MRWIKQNDGYSCAPVAVGNALKWSGRITSYHKIKKKLMKDCGTIPGEGSYGLSNAMFKWFPHARVWRGKGKIKIRDVDYWLRFGGAIVISYLCKSHGRLHRHATFMAKRTKSGRYAVINDSTRSKTSYRTRSQIKSYLQPVQGERPAIWLITAHDR